MTGGPVAQLLAYSTTGTAMQNLVGGPTGWVGTRNGPTALALGTDVYGVSDHVIPQWFGLAIK